MVPGPRGALQHHVVIATGEAVWSRSSCQALDLCRSHSSWTVLRCLWLRGAQGAFVCVPASWSLYGLPVEGWGIHWPFSRAPRPFWSTGCLCSFFCMSLSLLSSSSVILESGRQLPVAQRAPSLFFLAAFFTGLRGAKWGFMNQVCLGSKCLLWNDEVEKKKKGTYWDFHQANSYSLKECSTIMYTLHFGVKMSFYNVGSSKKLLCLKSLGAKFKAGFPTLSLQIFREEIFTCPWNLKGQPALADLFLIFSSSFPFSTLNHALHVRSSGAHPPGSLRRCHFCSF